MSWLATWFIFELIGVSPAGEQQEFEKASLQMLANRIITFITYFTKKIHHIQVFNVRYKRPRGSGTLLPLQLPHPCLIFQKSFKTSLNKMIENLAAVFFREKIDFDPSGTPSATGVDLLSRKSEGAKCFCKIWLNFIILFQFRISEYCHQIQMKTKKKGRRRILVLSQSEISNCLFTP